MVVAQVLAKYLWKLLLRKGLSRERIFFFFREQVNLNL